MKKLILSLYIGLIVGAVAALGWHVWGHLFKTPKVYEEVGLVSIYDLLDRPLTYLMQYVVVRGYLYQSDTLNNGDPVLFVNKQSAEREEYGTYLLVNYPRDGKELCVGHMVEISGAFLTIWPDQEKQIDDLYVSVPDDWFGISGINYLGKIEDVAPGTDVGLLRPSCPSEILGPNFGVVDAAPQK